MDREHGTGEEQNTSKETNSDLSAGSRVDGRTNEPNDSQSESTIETILSTSLSGSPSNSDNVTSSSFSSHNVSNQAAQGDSDTDSCGRDRGDGNDVAESAARPRLLPWKRKGDINASATCRVDEVLAQVGKMSESEIEKLPELALDSWASADYVARTCKLPPKDFKYTERLPAQQGTKIHANAIVSVTDSEAHSEQEKACEDSRSSLQETQQQSQVHLEDIGSYRLVSAQHGNNAAEDAAHSELMNAQQTSNNNASESHGEENVEQKTSEDSRSSP